jgi:hypothetical protein
VACVGFFYRLFTPSSHLGPYTRSLPCALALVDVPDISHHGWSPGLLVPQSKPHVRPSPLPSISTAHLYLTFTPPLTTAFELHTYTIQVKRHVVYIAFVMVGLVTTQSSSWIMLTITHHKTKHKGTFQPCVRSATVN